MANVITLHPSIRENHNPRMSAAALSEYLIMKPDQQETVLHNSRFSSPPVVMPYGVAMNAIRAFNADPKRNKNILESAKEALTGKSLDKSITPKSREESLLCLEAIDLFEKGERNVFGLSPLSLTSPKRFDLMEIEGVSLSVQPDLLNQVGGLSKKSKTGVIMFRPQKAPDPEACRLEETKRQRGEHRREMGRYMLAMAQMLIEANESEFSPFSREDSFVADFRLQERIEFSTSDHAARVRAINAACRQISGLWDGIEPRKSALAKR